MKIGVPRETASGEKRVALVPETAAKLVKRGLEVVVEAGAGVPATYADAEYEKAGATIGDPWSGDLVLKVQKESASGATKLKEGATLVSFLYPLQNTDVVLAIARRKAGVIAVDMIPRTSLAQSMDALSSQANLAGYKAVLIAAERLPRFFPMLMTAAGTITPARVLVFGAGVAGLQAIGTAKRLGAVVEATDVRPETKEQVESLGGKFLQVTGVEIKQGTGGYAAEQSEEYKQKQAELVSDRISKADVVITTALIPGRKAPILVTAAQVKSMRPGSIIVDLAAEQGGNVEGTVAGQEAKVGGVTIVGHPNLPSTMAGAASQLYSRNLEKLLGHLLTKENTMKWDFNDEITKGCVIVHKGEIVNAKVKEAMEKAGAKA
ncbi:MAG TPA: Re/Si-specific NAD(P)(+) transhydrogenase subunit alpha [Planctomycetota bacterium]|nr:Re/Si-specific NAD(P)(+) transhydrogenase subunit alpha [Planctomycetota bacterium]